MMKDWLHWIGGGSRKSAKRGRVTREDNATPKQPPPTGCMCFQNFYLNHFHFPLVHQRQQSLNPDVDSFLLQDDVDHEPTIFKGVEAPRNSLEIEENLSSNEASSMSSTMKEEATFRNPVGIQIRTSCDSKSPRESTSECSSSSPGTKTPGLVARLMGLDLLPEDGSPSSSRFSTSSMKSRLHHHYSAGSRNEEDRARNLLQNKSRNGTRSLPGTPRASSSSERRSDVDQSRLSLQIINKEGDNDQQFELASYIAKRVVARRREELARGSCRENESSSQRRHDAKQIVKQMKENISRRKFGHDITNSVKSRDEKNVVLLKPTKKSLTENDQRFLEIKKHHNRPPHVPKLLSTENQKSPPEISLAMNISQDIKPDLQLIQKPQNHQPKTIHKVAKERYNLHIKKSPPTSGAAMIWNKKEEAFIRSPPKNKDNNSNKTLLSNELLSKNVPTILPSKKDTVNSPSTKLFHHQSREVSKAQSSRKTRQQLHKSLSQSYDDTSCSVTVEVNGQERCNDNGVKTSSVNGDADAVKSGYYYLLQYIQRILKRTGIHSSTPISLTKLYSSSHPLDPEIFHYIELFHYPNNSILNLRSNRKLMFHLVDEILAQILKPYVNFKPWVMKFSTICPQMNGSELIAEICSRVESYPLANCQVLEEIDALIENDLRGCLSSFEEEGEGIVREIERYIVEYLVHEMAEEVLFVSSVQWAVGRAK